MQSVVIVGAGAMGCLFAAWLAEGGATVTLAEVDPARIKAIRENGIHLSDDRGERVVKVDARPASEIAGPVDLVLIFTKGMHTAAAVRSVAHLAKQGAYALTLQNGIGNSEVIAETFAPDHVLHGIADLPADIANLTHVSSHGGGYVRFGGYVPEAQPAALKVAELFKSGHIDARPEADIAVAIWEKLAFNASLNSIGTVLSFTNGEVAKTSAKAVALALASEAVDVAEAKGLKVNRQGVMDRIEYALKNHHAHKASMLQDRLAGRPTEIETITAAVVREGAPLGVPTPVAATLADLVRALEGR